MEWPIESDQDSSIDGPFQVFLVRNSFHRAGKIPDKHDRARVLFANQRLSAVYSMCRLQQKNLMTAGSASRNQGVAWVAPFWARLEEP